MSNLFRQLWADEAGIVGLEYLLVATVIGLGLVVGLAAFESALNVELTELANAVLAIDQGFGIDDQSNCKGFKDGWGTTDVAQSHTYVVNTPAASPVDVSVCP